MYIVNEIPIKLSMTFLTDIEKSVLKSIWKHQRSQTAKAILSKKKEILDVSQKLTSKYTTELYQ
jgi:predicted transcriptional regulator